MVVLSPAELALEQRRFEVMAPVTARRMELHLAEPLQKGVRGTETTERQPIDWRAIAAAQVGLEADISMTELYPAVRRSFESWLPFLQERFGLDDRTLVSLEKSRAAAYLVGTATEDNLPG